MKIFLSTLLFLSFVCFSIAVVAQIRAVSFNNGTYINLCGTGTQATSNTCNSGCDINKGTCSSNGSNVVKFTCDGRVTDCRSNESGFTSSQNIGAPGCGKTVQIDIFSKNCRASGGWDCSEKDLQDYMVWYSGDCGVTTKTMTATSCTSQQPMTVLFKRPNDTKWVDGNSFSNTGIKTGEEFEVNCFATNGTSLLAGGNIEITPPEGQTSTISDSSELRNYRSFQTGSHRFKCVSKTISSCSVSDSVQIQAAVVSASPTTPPSPSPKSILDRFRRKTEIPNGSGNPVAVAPAPTTSKPNEPEHQSQCEDLDVISGNNSTVPATVRFRAKASDNKGNIQQYRFYFGDGKQEETANAEIEHRYESSGDFSVRAEIKDAKGNWKSSSYCENRVTIKPSPVESHKSSCSDISATTDNSGQAPSLVKVKVNGHDNKGSIQHYRVDFGNGVVRESGDQTLEYRFEKAGTYVVKAYVKDSQGNWVGGSNNCQKTVYINTKPLTKQPETGTPTLFTAFGIFTGASGFGLQWLQRRMKR